MDLIAYLRVFRRRWILILLPALAAVGIAWWTLPEQTSDNQPAVSQYSATATLIRTPDLGVGAGSTGASTFAGVDLSVVKLYTSVGEVPVMAAKTLGYTGDPLVLASSIQVLELSEVATLQISSSGSDPDELVAKVTAFADAVTTYFAQNEDAAIHDRVAELQRQAGETTKKLRDVQEQLLADEDDPILKAQLVSLQDTYGEEFSEIRELRRQLGGAGPLTVLQDPSAIPDVGGGFTAPTNPVTRLALAALLGIALGASLALVIERVDSRIRTREQAEDSFGLPVLAEIPPQPWTQRKSHAIVSHTKPASATAEAFRALRSSILLLGPTTRGARLGTRAQPIDPSVIMVTSALPQEGKTTTAANLAVVMAEVGRSVIVLSLDLRAPRIHEFFGLENHTGVSDLLAADRGNHLEQVLRETEVAGVRVATSGREMTHPGALLAGVGPLIERARELADVVIVDTAPMLTVSDAVDLAAMVDVAIVVARMNATTMGEAESAQRLLSRLKVPALGTVLTGARDEHARVPLVRRRTRGRGRPGPRASGGRRSQRRINARRVIDG